MKDFFKWVTAYETPDWVAALFLFWAVILLMLALALTATAASHGYWGVMLIWVIAPGLILWRAYRASKGDKP